MQCPQCQHEHPAGAKFCNQCAVPLLLRCPACATENPPDAKFCHQCATPLTTLSSTSSAPQPEMLERFTSPQAYTPRHLAEKILTSHSALEGECKQVTVLFCDLANSGRFELGRVLYTLGYSYYFLGALVRALKGAAQVEAIGEATEDRRLQMNGAALKEWAAELTVDLS